MEDRRKYLQDLMTITINRSQLLKNDSPNYINEWKNQNP